MPHHLHLVWIRLFWCLLFSNKGSKVTCTSDFYTLLLNKCQQSTVVPKGTVWQYLSEDRRAATLTLSRVSQWSRGCWTSAQWRGTLSWTVSTGTQISKAQDRTGEPHSCNPAEATGLGLRTAPEPKGSPKETHSPAHSSLGQDYMAAPYPRWTGVQQPNELLEDRLFVARTHPILQVPTAPSSGDVGDTSVSNGSQ